MSIYISIACHFLLHIHRFMSNLGKKYYSQTFLLVHYIFNTFSISTSAILYSRHKPSTYLLNKGGSVEQMNTALQLSRVTNILSFGKSGSVTIADLGIFGTTVSDLTA